MTGAIVWFTGLPAAGKTTLAERVHDELRRCSLVLDSDAVRDVLGMQGYGDRERDQFYARLTALAAVVAAQGLVALVAATAPKRAHRDAARSKGLPFIEVWVSTSLADCERRDRKGLYAAARRGEVLTLPGVGAAYEQPLHAEIVAAGGHDESAVQAILERLQSVADAHRRSIESA